MKLKPIQIWHSIDQFYDQRGGRRSGEIDYGVWHRNDLDWYLPADYPCRVSVVDTTGDVYAIAELSGHIALLGTLHREAQDSSKATANRTHGLQDSRTYRLAQLRFEHWAEDPSSLGKPLSWFIERLPEPELEGSARA